VPFEGSNKQVPGYQLCNKKLGSGLITTHEHAARMVSHVCVLIINEDSMVRDAQTVKCCDWAHRLLRFRRHNGIKREYVI